MNKDINEASVDISRRSILGRLGLAASVAIAAPVLMTMSAPALANHKAGKDQSCSNGADRNAKAQGNAGCGEEGQQSGSAEPIIDEGPSR